MTPELLNKLKHLANIAAHLPHDVTLEDEDAAMKALHGELAADTVLQMIALAERALLAAAPAPIQKEPSLAPDYSAMSREALERHAARMAQQLANDKARQFYDKYATGPMMTPSCLCCGKLPDKVAIKHAELPGIVVCEECRNAAGSQVQAAGDVPWRVAEFWSSANPGKKCLMLAKDEQELSEWGKRSDFIRWCSPDPKATQKPNADCSGEPALSATDMERELFGDGEAGAGEG